MPLLARYISHLALLFVLMPAATLHARLQPGQVVVLANRNSADSLAVARHYAMQRGLTQQQIISLDVPLSETISRSDYESRIVLPLRAALQRTALDTKARALVVTYDLPLRVGAPILTSDESRSLSDAGSHVRAARDLLAKLESSLPKIAVTDSVPPPPSLHASGESPVAAQRAAQDFARIGQAIQSAIHRVQAQAGHAEFSRWEEDLTRLIVQYAGRGAFLPARRDQQEPLDVAVLRQQVEEGERILRMLMTQPRSRQRHELYLWVQQLFGLQGVLALAAAEVDALNSDQADASLDSELSLLWWDRSDYAVAWRTPNPVYIDAPKTAPGGSDPLPLLMVSRIDAPSPLLSMQLVDRAMEAERQGLAGTVYLDARGLAQIDTYGRYDESLGEVAKLLRGQGTLRVRLDNREQRFSEPGEAPDVALYIGWYRLRAYEDAFVFRPGAIGYHMASAEAVSIRADGERGWCRNALLRGITVTLGSVAEPYLDAFPEPAQWIRLLASGRYSLIESYYLANRYVSWRMTLFGDPLYNPWQGRSIRLGKADEDLPIPPADRPIGDPVAMRGALRQKQDALRVRLDQILGEVARHAQPGP